MFCLPNLPVPYFLFNNVGRKHNNFYFALIIQLLYYSKILERIFNNLPTYIIGYLIIETTTYTDNNLMFWYVQLK
jgi:hypothetical protein